MAWDAGAEINESGKKDVLHMGVVYGEGIASYMNDGGTDLGPTANLTPVVSPPILPAPPVQLPANTFTPTPERSASTLSGRRLTRLMDPASGIRMARALLEAARTPYATIVLELPVQHRDGRLRHHRIERGPADRGDGDIQLTGKIVNGHFFGAGHTIVYMQVIKVKINFFCKKIVIGYILSEFSLF